ncbi:endonuclease/exonuclease/phosphatase family protein [Mongoliimonas terrestris]|uniref:endonuclease/exonuclease/phosphatase family protein n=1 Tax=Mongoliimonas terrestris TaxID=1709001 RepID=UPI000949943F|nr:endonuclease/exonuclease/phosphatase family protein [Mongoliimonas terrestris]
MKILCLNGWGGRLHDALAAYVAAEDPDVLCLQEVVHTPATGRDWLTYRDGDHVLPQRANFFADVSAVLPGHVATFCPAARGVLYDGDDPVPSYWGLATFVRSSLPIVGQAQGFVHKDYGADGYGEHPRSRIAHAVRIHGGTAEGIVTIAHMHGLRDLAGKMDTPERAAQAHRLAELVRFVAGKDDPVVVCGDFNVEPESETFRILAGLGLADLVTASGSDGTRTSHYGKPGRFADYMLVNEKVRVRRFEVVAMPEVSDHRPIVLEI